MPFEQAGDQKDVRISQYHQLRNYIFSLAGQAQQAKGGPCIGSEEELAGWQKTNRPALERLLGFPAPVPEYEPQLISEEGIGSDELVKSIRRMTIRVAEGLDVYGILLMPHKEKPRLMLCFHGGLGCPELVTSVCPSANYNDGARKFVELGFAVFAPLLVLRREETDPDWPEAYRAGLHMNALWAGTSVMAIEVEKIRRAIRFFKGYGEVDASSVGVAGLSYGGYYALYTAALLEEIAFSVSSCHVNDRLDVMRAKPGDLLDWQYPMQGARFSDADLAALICPRPLYVEAGQKDELLGVEGAKREAEKIRSVYEGTGAGEKFFFDPFDGTHEFNLGYIGEFFEKNIF